MGFVGNGLFTFNPGVLFSVERWLFCAEPLNLLEPRRSSATDRSFYYKNSFILLGMVQIQKASC